MAQILTILFVCFKVFGLVNWSWWVVFSPMIVLFIVEVLAEVTK